MDIITRAKWGARAPKYVNRGPMLAQSTCHYNGPDIIVAGKKTWDHSKCAGLVRGIQNFHMDGRGWSDIAYNFITCPHGYTFEGRGLNTYNGANGTTSGNKSSHAIMSLAGEGNLFTDVEKIEFRQCVEYIKSKTNCHDGCKGHRDHKSTACPGDIRYKWVHAGMPVDEEPDDEEGPVAFDESEKEFLRNLATEIAGNRTAVDDYGQTGVRRDVWRWTAEAVTILRQSAVDKIVAGVLEGINAGDVDEATLMSAVEAGVRNVLKDAAEE